MVIQALYRDAGQEGRFPVFVNYQGGGGPTLPGGSRAELRSCIIQHTQLEGGAEVLVEYELGSEEGSYATLLSTVAGMLPFFPGVELVDVRPHITLAGYLRALGPALGASELWRRLKAAGPLVGYILKPPHLSLPEQSRRMAEMICSGAHIVKDDDLALGDSFNAIRRIKVLGPVLKKATRDRNCPAVLFVYASGEAGDVLKTASVANGMSGEVGLMLAPALTGFDTVARVRSHFPNLLIAVHPAFMQPYISYGALALLSRLAGADLVVLPAPGSFALDFNSEDARGVLLIAAEEMGNISPSVIGFGGGINPVTLSKILAELGAEIAVLIGSWAAAGPDIKDQLAAIRDVVARVKLPMRVKRR